MSHKAFTYHAVPVRGSAVTAYLTHSRSNPDWWSYSLWDQDEFLMFGHFDEPGLAEATPDQVARIAFLLELEY